MQPTQPGRPIARGMRRFRVIDGGRAADLISTYDPLDLVMRQQVKQMELNLVAVASYFGGACWLGALIGGAWLWS